MNIPHVPKRQTPRFATSIFKRTMLEGIDERAFGDPEIEEVIAFFGGLRCVYCDDTTVGRWDHLVPVRDGGETVKGNMVPSCSACDDSKAQTGFETWLRGGAARSPKSQNISNVDRRVLQLREYQTHFGYVVRTMAERLNEHERTQLDDLLAQLTGSSGNNQSISGLFFNVQT